MNVVGTPGSGFGAAGEDYFRISAFNSRENVEEAMQRITEKFKLSGGSFTVSISTPALNSIYNSQRFRWALSTLSD